MKDKSTVEEIQKRFDHDVERFSNLETGQSSTMDAAFVMDLITRSAALCHPEATRVLDIGCGAGNYALKLLEHLLVCPKVSLLDLSGPMLQRAKERISKVSNQKIHTIQGDIRDIPLVPKTFDLCMAAAVFHHLRDEREWKEVFSKIWKSLKPGGTLWISDLITYDHPIIQKVMWEQYGDYLVRLRDETYRDHVFDYIEKEDTPKSVPFQEEMLKQVGFSKVDVLHKNCVFAALVAFK